MYVLKYSTVSINISPLIQNLYRYTMLRIHPKYNPPLIIIFKHIPILNDTTHIRIINFQNILFRVNISSKNGSFLQNFSRQFSIIQNSKRLSWMLRGFKQVYLISTIKPKNLIFMHITSYSKIKGFVP